MREAGGPRKEASKDAFHSHSRVHDPPGVVMLSPQTILRKAGRQSEGPRHRGGVTPRRGQGQYKGRSPVGPQPYERSRCAEHWESCSVFRGHAPRTGGSHGRTAWGLAQRLEGT